MPQISLSVDQATYDKVKHAVQRHGDGSVANAVRKLVTCYANRIIFFRGLVPDIHRGRLDEYELEIFQGELPDKGSAVVPSEASIEGQYAPKEGEPIDWERVQADLKKEKK